MTFLFKELKNAGFPQKVTPGARFVFDNDTVATVLTVKGTYEPETRVLIAGAVTNTISVELLGKIGYLIPNLDTILANLPSTTVIKSAAIGRTKRYWSFIYNDFVAIEENNIVAGVLLWMKINATDIPARYNEIKLVCADRPD